MFEEPKKLKELDFFVVMDAKWWICDWESDYRFVIHTIIDDLSSPFYGNKKTRFILITDNEEITPQHINEASEHLFKHDYKRDTRIYSFTHYKGLKAEAIRNAIADLPEDAVYVVFDEENFYETFPGHSVMLDITDYKNCLIKACRFMKYGYWWNYRHRFESFRWEDYIRDNFKNVIFLDIDGVLNADDYQDPVRIHENRVAMLAEIVKATKAEIILSSSWRHHIARWMKEPKKSEEGKIEWGYELIRLLARYDLTIAGVTEEISSGPDARPLEIRSWLAKRTQVVNFVILDDDDFWTWYWLSPHAVLTSERHNDEKGWSVRTAGLKQEHIDKAIEILNWYKEPERD